jgi:hypothetical protein
MHYHYSVVGLSRFWKKVDKAGPVPPLRPDLGPCWVWKAYVDHGGYGRFRAKVGPGYAHIFAYEAEYGEVPTGLEIDHLCRTRSCVNPAHLEAVTRRVNALRGEGYYAKVARGEMVRKPQTHCNRGHERTPETTRLYVWRGRAIRYCRACYRLKYKERRTQF